MAALAATLVLASASPRRRDLLRLAGFDPHIRPAEVDETRHDDEEALTYVERVAIAKATTVERQAGEIVVAADTAVVLGGAVLGKPVDDADAEAILRRLSGRTHTVATGVVVRGRDDDLAHRVVVTRVRMAALSPAAIRRYVATGEPGDKAGGYAIQGRGAALVASLHGSWTNVVGLPLVETVGMLRRAGLVVD